LPVRFCYAAILPILSLARYRTQRTQEDRLKPVPLKPKFKNAGQRPAVRNPTHSFASSSRAREAPLNLEHRQECLCYLKSKSPDAIPGLRLRRDLRCESNFGAVEWIRTTTVLLPPAPQAGASASSATTARADVAHLFRGEAFLRETTIIGGFRGGVNIRASFSGSAFTKWVHEVRSRNAPTQCVRAMRGLLIWLLQKVSRSASRRFSALASNSARSLPISRRCSAALTADSSVACARRRMRCAAGSSGELAASRQYTTPTSSFSITERIVAASPRAIAFSARSRGEDDTYAPRVARPCTRLPSPRGGEGRKDCVVTLSIRRFTRPAMEFR
jgi:hypothetical protein